MSLKRILFSCTGNYYRSRSAEELFNHRAAEQGIGWDAISRALAIERGSNNIGPVSPFTADALNVMKIVSAGLTRTPKACGVEDLQSADLVVALKEAEHRVLLSERFAGWQDRVTYWHVDDIDLAKPAEALAMIDQLVSEVVRDLN
jgi:protein-tyrosine phosphatase